MLGVRFWRLVVFDFPHGGVEIPVTLSVLEMTHAKLEVFVGDVCSRRFLCVVRKDVVALNAPVYGRKGYVVTVERRAPLVVHHAVRREIGLGRVLSALEPFDATLDGFDRPSNPFLDEVRGKVGFVSEGVVKSAFGFGFRGNVVSDVAIPAPVACAVGAVLELLDRLSECWFGVRGRVEFDDGGSTVFHDVSHYGAGLLKDRKLAGNRSRMDSHHVGFLPRL